MTTSLLKRAFQAGQYDPPSDDDDKFKLTNKTLLRGFLAHLHSHARRATMLRGELMMHPDTTSAHLEKVRPVNPEVTKAWEALRVDLEKVLGLQLVPYHQLGSSRFPTGDVDPASGGRDLTRITMRELKARADKARVKDPTIVLLKAWKLEEHEPDEDDSGSQYRYRL